MLILFDLLGAKQFMNATTFLSVDANLPASFSLPNVSIGTHLSDTICCLLGHAYKSMKLRNLEELQDESEES